jgi:chromate transporter
LKGGSNLQLIRLALSFAKAGLFTFGSGYAMLALLQKEIVEVNGWLTPEQFADVVSLAEITPGPITVNMATFVGYKIAGIPGSISATLGLIIGPIIIILIAAKYYLQFRNHPWIESAFKGLRPTVAALITTAVIKLGKTSFIDYRTILIFIIVLASVYILKINPIIMALLGILAGIIFF